ncbi:MAG: gamma-glutamyltransferase [Anaerolineae bacterium]|nr:gamma-glutamyltransferase [Anaerolineae bacterium]
MTRGIIAGGSQQTADAGAEMLRMGGNAVDAAVAAAFASFVAESTIASIGGGGFATITGPGQAPMIYDFFVNAPGLGAEPRPPGAIDFQAVPIAFSDTTEYYHIGRGSSAVPGNVAGLALILEEAGTLPLAAVVAPAIRLAREGFALSEAQAYMTRLLATILRYTPECGALFAPEGRPLEAGERFANPAFAATLEQLASAGSADFYSGALAAAIVADQQAGGGLITAADLAGYRVIKREPLRFSYRGATILTNPPPSLGGILIAYALGVLERAPLGGKLSHSSAAHISLLAEIMRAASTVRQAEAPARLTTPEEWAAFLHPDRLDAAWAEVLRALREGPPRPRVNEPGAPPSTTHISALDENGLAVSLTTTPGETGGYVVGSTGMLMNNILGEADLNPDGFHRWAPGARLSSMMAPSIVLDAEGPRLVIGSGGANRLRSAMLQVISNVLDFGLKADKAANWARVHFERGLLDLEAGIDDTAATMLELRGYHVNRWASQSLYFGGTHLVLRREDGRLTGAGDRRRGGAIARVD